MPQNHNFSVLRSTLEAYGNFCKPLCRELGMPQMALDILLFLDEHPQRCTAKDISRSRGLKESVLSVNINKLVVEGYLERRADPEDRRRVQLRCTEKAAPMIERGRNARREFIRAALDGLTEEELTVFRHCLDVLDANAERIKHMEL